MSCTCHGCLCHCVNGGDKGTWASPLLLVATWVLLTGAEVLLLPSDPACICLLMLCRCPAPAYNMPNMLLVKWWKCRALLITGFRPSPCYWQEVFPLSYPT